MTRMGCSLRSQILSQKVCLSVDVCIMSTEAKARAFRPEDKELDDITGLAAVRGSQWGRLVWEFYDELERICTDYIELSPKGPVVALNVPQGQWHTVKALESGSVILECKEGAYEPLSDVDILS